MSGQGALDGLGWRHAVLPLAVLLVASTLVAFIVGPSAMMARIAGVVPVIVLVLVAWCVGALPALRQAAGQRVLALAALGAVAALFVLNILVLTLPRVGPFAELEWNWQGKTLDLVWCLAVIAMLSSAQRREIGWTWKIRSGTLLPAFINIAILALVGFVAFGTTSSGDMEHRTLSLEQVLFDTTYPNLVEEVVFRGFMMALLDRAFPPRWSLGRTQVGWGVVLTAWLFGLVHGISLGPEGAVVFDPLWLVMTLAAGLVFGWIRALTGSLWPAFLAHCAPEIGILVALALR